MIELITNIGLLSAVMYLLILLYLIIGIIRTKTELTDEQPFVSVIVAAHNEDQNIKACLDALLNQDYSQEKMEIIVVNDRSEDDTGVIVNKYEKNNTLIRVLTISDCVLGLSPKKNALTHGINIANGEINEVTDADKVLDLLKSFENVATLHGHDHENCRHSVEGIQILTTAAVAGGWWRNGLESPNVSGEPQGFRVIDIDSGKIRSRYVVLQESQPQLASWYVQAEAGRYFIYIFDASPGTQVYIDDIGKLQPLNPFSDSAKQLSPHFYELSSKNIEQVASKEVLSLTIVFEDGQTNRFEIDCPSFG